MLFALLAACTLSTPEPQAAQPAPSPAIEAGAKAVIGQPAPEFALLDLDGKPVKLSDHAGKVVVLEWFNPGCPFVKAAYNDEVLPQLHDRYANQEVSYLMINSGAAGKQGAGVDENKRAVKSWDISTPVLQDPSGAVGMAYGAKTTPQIVVIDRSGVVRFNGALDNAPLSKVEGTRVPYAEQAIDAVLAGGDIETTSPKPWGCSVKYAQ
ncbi:MAG: redoxin domain-containing protein [Myxococcota bacterium]|nr:redoxin domain-containing protein [Myxococcota bacterium]